MTKKINLIPLVFLCAVLVLISTAEASSLFKHKQSRAFSQSAATAPGKTLYIDTYSADLTLTEGDENAVTVEGIVEVSDEDKEVVQFFVDET